MFRQKSCFATSLAIMLGLATPSFSDNFQGIKLGYRTSNVPERLERWCDSFTNESSKDRFIGRQCSDAFGFPVSVVVINYEGFVYKTVSALTIYYDEGNLSRILGDLTEYFTGNSLTYHQIGWDDCLTWDDDDGTRWKSCDTDFAHNKKRDFFTLSDNRSANDRYLTLSMRRE